MGRHSGRNGRVPGVGVPRAHGRLVGGGQRSDDPSILSGFDRRLDGVQLGVIATLSRDPDKPLRAIVLLHLDSHRFDGVLGLVSPI